MKSKILSTGAIVSCLVCVASMGYSISTVPQTQSLTSTIASTLTLESYLQPIIAMITGAVLSVSCLFFFLRRMILQYDKKHDKHDKDILIMQKDLRLLETNLVNKLHDKADSMNRDIRENLQISTDAIVESLKSLHRTLRDLLSDFAALKADHSKCDYKTGDINFLKSQITNLVDNVDKIEGQFSKHVEDK